MKDTMKRVTIPPGFLAVAALAIILAGCVSPLTTPVDSGYVERVTFTVGGGERTVLPSISQFGKIILTFTGAGETVDLPDALIDGATGSVTVEIRTAGAWEVRAEAYIGEEDEDPAAVSVDAKTLSWDGPGTTAEVTGGSRFTLEPAAEDTEPGTLRYAVTLPEYDGFTLGAGSRLLLEQEGIALDLDTDDFTDGVRDIDASIATTDLSLPVGLYVADILIVDDDSGNVAVYRKSVAIVPGLITAIDFSPEEAEFLDPATAAAVASLGTDPFVAADDGGSISDIDFTFGAPATLDITALSDAEIVVFTLAKTEHQIVSVSGTDGDYVIRVPDGEDAGGSVAGAELAVFVAQDVDQGGKAFTITVTEPGVSGSVVVDVTVTREAAGGMGFGLYSKAAAAGEEEYEKVDIPAASLDDILKYLGVAGNVAKDTSYLALIDGDQDIAPWSSVVNNTKTGMEITLRGINMKNGENWKVKWDKTTPNSTTARDNGLIKVKNGTTLILDNGITLDGDNTKMTGLTNGSVAMVVVLTLDGNPKAPAQFIMREGSKIINCLAEPSNTTNGGGAAVNIGQQTAGNMDSAFIMEGGEISGNTAKYAIVHLFRGRFVMQGGKISNNYLQNEAVASGAVLINGGTFSLTNGEISDNTLRGVYISSAGMTIEGGKITRNGTGTINGNPITGAGIYDSSTTNANPSIIKGGEISGNGSPDSVGSALACNSNNFTLSGNPAIEGSILLKAYQIFLDKSFVNAHDNGEEGEYVFPLFLHGSWTENKAVLKPTGEETTVAISKFNLAGIYSGNDYDLTLGSLGSRYLKDDGTIGINPE